MKRVFGFGSAAPWGILPTLCIACLAIGCVGDSTAVAQPGARRSNVAQPFITLSPASVALAEGASVALTAKPQGGEAMLFTVDWRVQEGAVGGMIEGIAARNADGSFDAIYTAPSAGSGPFHVVASIHEYPSAFAITNVTVPPRH